MGSPAPSLDELAADPTKATTLPVEAARALLARCVVAHGVLVARLLEAPHNGAMAVGEDRLLDVEEAARLLHVSPDWIYRRASRSTLPFVVRLGRTVRCSAHGITRYIRRQQGR